MAPPAEDRNRSRRTERRCSVENKVYAVTAPEPWGPFGEPRLLFEGIAPEDGLISGVNLVPGFTSADGSRLLVSYHSGPSVRFVDVVLK